MMRKSSSNLMWAVVWFVLCITIGCANNAILKYTGSLISPWHVTFYRSFFGAVTLFPFMLYQGMTSFQTQRLWLHFVRGILFATSMNMWCYGIQKTPIATATVVSFTTPLFVLLLAPFLLKERVTWPIWATTLLSFGGVFLALQPSRIALTSSFFLLLASVLFGLLDILNKKQISQESMLCMLFYVSFFAFILLAPPVVYARTLPRMHAVCWLLCLGIGNNLLLYCLLKAFALTSASSLAPFRYLELPISIMVGYVFFQEIPDSSVYLGAAIIIPCALFSAYYRVPNT